jgi:hypothetical protein
MHHFAFGTSPALLLMSRMIFQLPSACRCQTARYFPVSVAGVAPFIVVVMVNLPVSIARSPPAMTSTVPVLASLTFMADIISFMPASIAVRPCHAGIMGIMTTALSA